MKIKKLTLFFISSILCINLIGQNTAEVYDSVLAKNLGADDYGMKSYILVLLTPGINHLEKGEKRDSIFRGHLKNIVKMEEAGQLVIAGPFEENDKSYRGIFILNVKTISEAKDMLQSDPAIQSKVLDAELYEWYGSAALSEYLKIQKKISRKQF